MRQENKGEGKQNKSITTDPQMNWFSLAIGKGEEGEEKKTTEVARN